MMYVQRHKTNVMVYIQEHGMSVLVQVRTSVRRALYRNIKETGSECSQRQLDQDQADILTAYTVTYSMITEVTTVVLGSAGAVGSGACSETVGAVDTGASDTISLLET
jgi:hypothetical protein